MGELTSTAVQRAVERFVERDDALAQKVVDDDDPIDELYLRIDRSILELLALQSPVAADLRLVSAILHCVSLGADRRSGRQRRKAVPGHGDGAGGAR